MSAVGDSTSTSGTSSSAILAALNNKTTTTTDSGTSALGQDAFLKLLITQLKNQNPLNPQDNTAFVAQLAQFSSLQGIQNLNTTMTSLSNSMQSSQALQASALVGRTVEVESKTAYLASGGTIRGTITLPDSTANMQLNIYNESNQLVMQKDLGSQEAGDIPFGWDGTGSDGTALPAGTYTFQVLAKDGKTSTPLTTYLSANVNSVTMGANQEVTLNVNGVGQVALSSVKDIL
jgi:flagellar basal-body rod modification protein FlgD